MKFWSTLRWLVDRSNSPDSPSNEELSTFEVLGVDMGDLDLNRAEDLLAALQRVVNEERLAEWRASRIPPHQRHLHQLPPSGTSGGPVGCHHRPGLARPAVGRTDVHHDPLPVQGVAAPTGALGGLTPRTLRPLMSHSADRDNSFALRPAYSAKIKTITFGISDSPLAHESIKEAGK